jgi:hypothetical protein
MALDRYYGRSTGAYVSAIPILIRAAGLLLKGHAASWHRDMMHREPNLQTWAPFKAHISLTFQPVGREKKARHHLDVAHQRANDSV